MSLGSEFAETITDLLIATIYSNKSVSNFDFIMRQREFARYKKESLRVGLSRLHKRGYLDNSKEGWFITKAGKLYYHKNKLFSYITPPFDKSESHNTIISFDITEPERLKRDWLRNQIKIFDYKMLQQSLWLGPGPLPLEFLKRLSDLGIRKSIKIFTIRKKNI